MGRFSKAISSPRVNIALFVIAAILLLISVVGGTQAALSYYSDTYLARLNVSNIGVTLLENDEPVAWRDYAGDDEWDTPSVEVEHRLLHNMLSDGERLQIGREYPERLQVQNTGEINQFVRVKLYKYWEDADGNKVNVVSPDLIRFNAAAGNGWLVDEEETTVERMVLYYNRALSAGEITPQFSSSISIDPSVVNLVTQEKTTEQEDFKTVTTIITKYDYDGLRFCLEAEVDAVQEHNVQDAVLSAWGKDIVVNNGILSLG